MQDTEADRTARNRRLVTLLVVAPVAAAALVAVAGGTPRSDVPYCDQAEFFFRLVADAGNKNLIIGDDPAQYMVDLIDRMGPQIPRRLGPDWIAVRSWLLGLRSRPVDQVEQAVAAEAEAEGSPLHRVSTDYVGRCPRLLADPGFVISRDPQDFPRQPGKLEPGNYRTTTFAAPFVVGLGSQWHLLAPETSTAVYLAATGLSDQRVIGYLSFLHVDRFFAPDVDFSSRDARGAGATVSAPDVVGWLRAHPRLRAGSPTLGAMGNRQAVRLDAVVTRPYPGAACPPGLSCIYLAQTADAVFTLLEGNRNRLFVAGDMLVVAEAVTLDFPQLVDLVERELLRLQITA